MKALSHSYCETVCNFPDRLFKGASYTFLKRLCKYFNSQVALLSSTKIYNVKLVVPQATRAIIFALIRLRSGRLII